VWWWLRSPSYASANYFCSVSSSGGYYYYAASWSAAVLPGFTT